MKLQRLWEEEAVNSPCWAIILFGVGIALYFSLPFEPPIWSLPPVFMLLILLHKTTKSPWMKFIILGAILLSAGVFAGIVRTWLVTSPQIERALYAAEIEGTIDRIEILARGYRVTLKDLRIQQLSPEETPRRLRLKLWQLDEKIEPGDIVAATASLQPLRGPAAPGAFDFRRDGFFQGLGATGFATQPLRLLKKNSGLQSHFFDQLRHRITQEILILSPGPAGAMIIALICGDQTALTQNDIRAMRDSGLAHLLSISGLHIALAFGLVFYSIRAVLALIPRLALYYPIKKWALLPAFAAAVFYSFLAGLPVPTERSLVMLAVMALAISLDRPLLSLRVIAVAAFIVLLFNPEAVIGPSFQLSFSAVLALIATYEFFHRYRFLQMEEWKDTRPRRALRWVVRWVMGIVCSSLVVTAATAPFAIYHFDRLALYGLLANMIAIPLTGTLVMPAAMASLIFMPFGWADLPLKVMARGCDWILWLAHTIQDLPYSIVLIPAMPVWGLICATAALLSLCVMAGRLRWLGLVFATAAILSIWMAERPDILVSADAKLFALRASDGNYYLSDKRRARLTADTWLKRNGQETAETIEVGDDTFLCDESGCLYKKDGKKIAVGYGLDSLAEDCLHADLVINLEPVREPCRVPVIDRFSFWRDGAYAIFINNGEIRIEKAASGQNRPWRAKRNQPRQGRELGGGK